MSFLLACAWIVCLLVAFRGYGRLILGLCRFRATSFTLCAAVGLCACTALGGVLNLLHGIRVPLLVAMVGVGLLLALLGWREWRRSEVSLGIVLLAAALAVPVLGNIRADVRSFNLYDDLPAYLTLPAETLQLHTLPADPFNERRVTSCLGASYFLQSLLLAGMDVREYRAVDVSIGSVLYAGILLLALERLGLARSKRFWMAGLILLVPVFRINTTFVVLPAALFCALFVLLTEEEVAPWGRALAVSLVAACLCALKSNYLPAAILSCVMFYLGQFVVRKVSWGVLREGLLCGVAIVVWLLPWMLDLHSKEGTYLFPVLGRGFDASAYGTVPLPNGSKHGVASTGLWVWITAVSFAGPYVVALGALALAWRKQVRSHALPLGALLLATVLAVVSLASSTGGESIGRYSLPFQVPVLLLFCGWLWRRAEEGAHKLLWWRGAAAVMGAYLVFLCALFGVKHEQYRAYLEDARLITPKGDSWFDPETEVVRVHRLQREIPAGETVLARMFVTYPFDFRRNRIFVADYTGMAGLPPGMPVGKPAEAVRQYLLGHGIRFLAYDYRRCRLPDDDQGTSLQMALADPGRYGRHGWLYMQVKVSNAEQDLFGELGRDFRKVYDDGTVRVTKLDEPRLSAGT